MDRIGVGLGEDRAHHRRHEALCALRDAREMHHRPQQIRARLLQLLAQPHVHVHRGLDHRAPPRLSSTGLREGDAGGQLCRALRARRRRPARLIEGRRAGDGAHLVALEHHERGRYSR